MVANNHVMSSALASKYATHEQKDPVILDKEELDKMHKCLITDRLYKIEENVYRHDALKTAYLIFSYLMDGAKNDLHD